MEIYLEYYRFDGIYVDLSSQLIYNYAKKLYNEDLAPLGQNNNYAISEKYAIVVESS